MNIFNPSTHNKLLDVKHDIGIDPNSKRDHSADTSLFLQKNDKLNKKYALHYYGNINNKFGVLKTYIDTQDQCNLEDYK